ncbi:helix-turn-helix domain-containing protein [Lysinibacillus fusiformis]|uniref:helix-turn-helix domain-containing protein n=1 Tax=Lysinibacillus fusiformis TaxID=28031 RepID=UPI003AABD170
MYKLMNTAIIEWQEKTNIYTLHIKYPTLLAIDVSTKIFLNGEWLHLAKSEMIYLCAEKIVTLKKADHQVVHLYIVSFQKYNLAKENDDELIYYVDHEKLPAHGSIAGIETLSYRAVTLFQELVGKSEACERYIYAKQNYFLEELLHLFIQALKPYKEKEELIMREALVYINRYFDQNLNRPQLAKLMGFNTSYFSRLFQQQIGRSFSNHLTRVRIDKAKMYLLSTDDTLNEIARKVGYTDGLYLSRKFKQIVGVSPSEYRQRPKPRRIVAFQYSGDLLALGIQPIAAPFTPWEVSPLIHQELGSAIDIEQGIHQLEKIEVDLIIAPEYLYYWPGKLEKLEQIAPILILPWNQLDRLEEVQLIGKIIGREAEANEWIEHYQSLTHIAATKLKLGLQVNVGLYEVWEDYTICIWNTTARATYNLYNGLRLTPHPRIQQEVLAVNSHLYIDEEVLADYAADVMFVVLPEDYYNDFSEKLLKRKAWSQLQDDPSRKIIPIRLNEFWCNDGLALEKQLYIMLEKLLTS